jgi:hypothetical protein
MFGLSIRVMCSGVTVAALDAVEPNCDPSSGIHSALRRFHEDAAMEELIRYMRASMLLQLYSAQAQSAQPGALPFKPEVLLADAGIPPKEIAAILGKSPAAVAKAISRARAARRSDEDGVGTTAVIPRSGDGTDA